MIFTYKDVINAYYERDDNYDNEAIEWVEGYFEKDLPILLTEQMDFDLGIVDSVIPYLANSTLKDIEFIRELDVYEVLIKSIREQLDKWRDFDVDTVHQLQQQVSRLNLNDLRDDVWDFEDMLYDPHWDNYQQQTYASYFF